MYRYEQVNEKLLIVNDNQQCFSYGGSEFLTMNLILMKLLRTLLRHLLLLLYIEASFALTNQIRSLDDSILFRVNWPGHDNSLLESPDYESLVMTTTNNEKYKCLIPVEYGGMYDDAAGYTGKDAFSLLMTLFNKQTCTIRLESYWTYEVCHGKHIKQYHTVKEGKNRRLHEYVLGLTTNDKVISQNAKFKRKLLLKPDQEVRTTKVEGTNMPYVRVDYSDGTICDLTGEPRSSHILYVCFEEGRHDIYSIKEVFTCEYEIVVLSPLLCLHPTYRPKDVPQTDVHCISLDEGPKRPRNLIKNDAESFSLIAYGGELTSDLPSGALKLELIDEVVTSSVPEILGTSDSTDTPVKAAIFSSQPSVDQQLVQDFLNGEFCLDGGSGWWKYEFCYGRRVDQYHEERDGKRSSTINLGQFDLEKHKEWIDKNPSKKYKEGRQYVSHFYSSGSVCDVTGKQRVVEVKLKCQQTVRASSLSMYLTEPEVCEYLLTLETSIVCPLLQHTDSLGLFTLSQAQTKGIISNMNNINEGKGLSSETTKVEVMELPGTAHIKVTSGVVEELSDFDPNEEDEDGGTHINNITEDDDDNSNTETSSTKSDNSKSDDQHKP